MIVRPFRLFSIIIPLESLKITHIQESTPKTEGITLIKYRVDVRFPLNSSAWLSNDVKESLKEMYPFFISKEGEFFIQSNSNYQLESTDPKENEKDAIEKIQKLIAKASQPRNVKKMIIDRIQKEKKGKIPPKLGKKVLVENDNIKNILDK